MKTHTKKLRLRLKVPISDSYCCLVFIIKKLYFYFFGRVHLIITFGCVTRILLRTELVESVTNVVRLLSIVTI